MKKKGRIESVIGKGFVGFLFAIMLLSIVLPDKEQSEEENRMLTRKPKVTMSALLSGDFMDQFEDYVSDQFVGRSFWRSMKVTLSRLGGSRMENGVYIGKKGQLMEAVEIPEEEQLTKTIDAINNFVKTNSSIQTSVMLVPDAACILEEELPPFADGAKQKKMLENVEKKLENDVTWIDAVSELEAHKDEKLYYQTDHHWTSLGAFYAFQKAAPALGIEKIEKKDYKVYPVSTNFNGVLASTSGVHLNEKEQIDIYVPKKDDSEFIVDYVEESLRKPTIYDASKLETKDQYAVFMGGNRSIIDIKTTSEKKNRLLLVKDSFANCFIQFLTPYYREIIVVDPRYYSGTIQDILNNYRITDALFLYRGNTFFTDNSLAGVFARNADATTDGATTDSATTDGATTDGEITDGE